MLYPFELPGQMVVLPEIASGIGGKLFTVILKVLGVEELQELFAVTEIFPLVLPAVVEIEVVLDDPVHPEGRLQL